MSLTENRIREVFREYARLSSVASIAGFAQVLRAFAIMFMSPHRRMAAIVKSLSSPRFQALAALGPEKQRVEAIARLTAIVGLEQARAEAGALSARAAREWRDIQQRPWLYTVWDYTVLQAANVTNGHEHPIGPEEVDAVANVLDEIRSKDRFFAMSVRGAELTGKKLRDDPSARTRRAAKRTSDIEARRWLKRKTRQSLLAANRFGTTEAGLEFVDELYAAGAMKVLVAGTTIQEDEGFNHADALRVKLPEDDSARALVLSIVNREAQREGFDDDIDTGQDEAYLWWD